MIVPGVLMTSLLHKYKYGYTKHGTPLYIFHPLDSSIPNLIVGSNVKNTLKNLLITVDYIPGNTRANIIQVLGESDNWDAEIKALLWQYAPLTYKKPLEPIQLQLKQDVKIIDKEYTTINIDPEGCQDIDDCISWRIENNTIYFIITIANVAYTLQSHRHYLEEAFKRGQTFYSENERRSMLPSNIEHLCSLIPNEYRNGISLFLTVKNNNIIGFHLEETVICNQRSFTYEDITENIPLEILKFLSTFSESNDSHKWIESLMLLYNKEVAKILFKSNAGIFRKHKASEVYKKYCPFLYYESAEYCTIDNIDRHSGLDLDIYCHITSPIRRYADLVNQLILTNTFNSQEINCNDISVYLNTQQKLAKKHSRDLFFLQKLRENLSNTIEGIFIEENKFYIPEWKQIVKVMDCSGKEGDTVILKYHYNRNEKLWRKRMVFMIDKTI
jgi:exoribonuclease R